MFGTSWPTSFSASLLTFDINNRIFSTVACHNFLMEVVLEGFIHGFLCSLGWLPVLLAGWLVKRSFTCSLDLGD